MTKFLTAALIATVAMGGIASANDNPAQDSRSQLEQLWDTLNGDTRSGQVSVTREDDSPRTVPAFRPNNRIKGEGPAFDRLRSVQPRPAG